MKRLAVVVLLFSSAFVSRTYAADATNPVHWYRVVVNAGSNTMSFIGSSPSDAEGMAGKVANASSIELNDRREIFGDQNRKIEFGLHPYSDAPKVLIITKSIVYIEELPGDPIPSEK